MANSPEVGTSVVYFSRNPKGATVIQGGIIVGFGNMQAGRNADFPPAHIAFLNPTLAELLIGEQWRLAFDRAIDVQHVSAKVGDGRYYQVPENPEVVRSTLLAELKTERAAHASVKLELDALKGDAPAPSSDPAAAKIRMVKGSKANG